MHRVADENKIPDNVIWINTIAHRYSNQRVEIYDILKYNSRLNNTNFIPPLNKEISRVIIEGKAYAATDSSMDDREMAGYWCIKDIDQRLLIHNTIYHKEWKDNTCKGAEAITLLELIEVIVTKGKHIPTGKIKIGFDNRLAYRKIVNAILKPSTYAQDSGAEISRIKTLLKEVSFEIELVLVKGHEAPKRPFQVQPLQHLINECDAKARRARENINSYPSTTNIKYVGQYAITHDKRIVSRSIKEIIRTTDSKRMEMKYAKRKLGYKSDFIDIDARDVFKTKQVSTSIIKCANAVNHYGVRNRLINKQTIGDECPRYSCPET